jgi:thymidylate synthase (FAD)
MGSDKAVIAAAKVSTQGVKSLDALDAPAQEGLIRYLAGNRHGTPFEHAAMTFFVRAPIFVFREFHRHRIGWSYNEESARYKELEGVFYVPAPDRPGMMQKPGGKPGQYEYVDASPYEAGYIGLGLAEAYSMAHATYKTLLDRGVAKEVARMCLPVATYSSMYATCNPRSLMAFLSLRTKRGPYYVPAEDEPSAATRELVNALKIDPDGAVFPSKPQYEINMVADQLERSLAELFPIVHKAFNDFGRVGP